MAKLCLKSAKITPQNLIIIKRLVVCLVAVYRPGPYWLDSSHVKLNNFPRVQPYVCTSAQAARKTGGTGRLVYLEFCRKKRKLRIFYVKFCNKYPVTPIILLNTYTHHSSFSWQMQIFNNSAIFIPLPPCLENFGSFFFNSSPVFNLIEELHSTYVMNVYLKCMYFVIIQDSKDVFHAFWFFLQVKRGRLLEIWF